MADPQLPKGYVLDNPEPTVPQGYKLDSPTPYKDPITAASETVAPAVGRFAAESLPAAGAIAGGTLGPVGAAAGTGLGTMVMQALKKLRPDLLGEAPSGAADIFGNLAKEEATNVAVPGIAGKLGELATRVGMQGPAAATALTLKNFPAVREGAVKQLTERIQEQLGSDYKPVGDFQPLKFQQKTADVQPISINQQPVSAARPVSRPMVMPEGPVSQVPSGAGIERVLGDFEKSDLKLGGMVGVGGKPVNAANAYAELTGENASRYADSMSPEGYSTAKDMLGTMKDLQKKNMLDRIITIRSGKLLFHSGAGALAAFGHPLTAAAIESPVILNSMLDRIMANPETAKLVTAAMQTPASAPQAGLIQKALTQALPQLFADVAATPDR